MRVLGNLRGFCSRAAGFSASGRRRSATHVRKKGTPDEIHIGLEGGGAAIVVFTEDLPDEARLALLDLDVTAEELRGKLLCWDPATARWRPSNMLAAELGDDTDD